MRETRQKRQDKDKRQMLPFNYPQQIARLISTIILLVLSATSTFACQDEAKSDSMELEAIAKKLLADPDLISEFRPGWQQARDLVKNPNDAAALYVQSQTAFDAITNEGWPVIQAGSNILVEECRLNDHCNEAIEERFNPVQLFTISYAQSEGKERAEFSVFAKLNDKWAFFPNPWDAIKNAEAQDTHPGTLFIKMLAQKLYSDAYEMSAPVVREVMTFEEFQTYFSSLNLNRVQQVTWDSTERVRKNSEQTLSYEGSLSFRDAPSSFVKLTFIFLDGEGPQPFQIELTTKLGATESYAFVPSIAACKRVVKDNIGEWVAAIEKAEFTQFHESNLGFQIRQSTTPESLKQTFEVFMDRDFAFFKDAKIKFSKRPTYSEKFRGSVNFEGSFRNPELGKVLTFTMNASEEATDKWLLNEFNVFPLREYDPNQAVPKMDKDSILGIATETSELFMQGMKTGDFTAIHQQFTAEFQEQLSQEDLKSAFVALDKLFKPDGLFFDDGNLEFDLRVTPAIDEDFINVSVAITEPGGEWIQGDINYVYVNGKWQILRIHYRY